MEANRRAYVPPVGAGVAVGVGVAEADGDAVGDADGEAVGDGVGVVAVDGSAPSPSSAFSASSSRFCALPYSSQLGGLACRAFWASL